MLVDLLDYKNDEVTYTTTKKPKSPESPEDKEQKVKKEVITVKEQKVKLHEEDPVWVSNRHMFIAKVTERVHNFCNEIKTESATAKFKEAKKAGIKVQGADYVNALRDQKDYNENVKRLKQHTRLCSDIMSMISKNDCILKNFAEFLQTLATSIQDDGEKMDKKAVSHQIKDFLGNENLSIEMKCRLLMVFVLSVKVNHLRGRDRLCQQLAKLPEDLQDAWDNLAFLGVDMSSGQFEAQQIFYKDNALFAFEKVKANDGSQRHKPILHFVLEALKKKTLSTDTFPYAPNSPVAEEPRKVFVYVLGGLSYNEMRIAYRFSGANPDFQIYTGSTSKNTPREFLQKMTLRSAFYLTASEEREIRELAQKGKVESLHDLLEGKGGDDVVDFLEIGRKVLADEEVLKQILDVIEEENTECYKRMGAKMKEENFKPYLDLVEKLEEGIEEDEEEESSELPPPPNNEDNAGPCAPCC